jgi:decaprenyl-phosphate phosphoribosyltransferase
MTAPGIERRIENAAPPKLRNSALVALLECMRPAQWVKNGFVFAPLIFSANLRSYRLMLDAGIIVAAFCACASGMYLWNDALDWKQDLVHPAA